MMQNNTTGNLRHRALIFGKVVAIRDLEPGRGGQKMARVAVARSPVGFAPLVARVRFDAGDPSQARQRGMTYERRNFYGVVGHQRDDGTFADDTPCGRSTELGRDRFWKLVRYDRSHT